MSRDLAASGIAVALIAVAAGILTRQPGIAMIAVVGAAFAIYGRSETALDPDLEVERRIEPRAPRPRERVAVVLVVTNRGDGVLTDVRIRESLPEELTPLDGDTACASSLRPDESVTLSYTLRARPGRTVIDPPTIECVSANGRRRQTVETTARTEWHCRAPPVDVPLAQRTTAYTGQEQTDTGGEGIEFHSVRAYRSGDPLSRVDWNRLASDGRLRTIEFRETRAASVVVVLDTTASTTQRRGPDEPAGRTLARQAAERVVDGLLDDHNRVGVATVGERTGYLAPGAGRDQAIRAERLLDGTSSGLALDSLRAVRNHLPADAQVVVCSPLLDDDALTMARAFRAADHPVTLLSPSVTDPATVGGTVERIARQRRIDRARRSGVQVLDWRADDPLERTLDAARHGWSR
ncbi:DUF58 domain-containing protein [Halococcoides cellulosivorans]|uniref:DUF58 domain-containing protein n=1 Tax=Halococcoides cellulosivorans TaxID=1679096 RepID=A0A2R4X2J6_9EURY|nr:DUF58 domain-containing protein [Halococcoides cellulosivorans]AWB28011.1 DUF58 domain-containing protein [Halococcoides cellulosivorans]